MFRDLQRWPILIAFAACLGARVYGAPILPGVVNGQLDPHLKGLVLLEELNCTACHSSPSSLTITTKEAPRLLEVGSRLNPYYMEAYINSPHTIHASGTMPDVMAHLDADERRQAATSITHFLISLKKGAAFSPLSPDTVAVERGQSLFHAVGCVACHSPRGENGEELLRATSVALGSLEQKYNVTSLAEFIHQPLHTRPSGRMPAMGLQRREAEDIAHYLLKETKIPGRIRYTIMRGRVWEGLDAETEKERAGMTEDFRLEALGKVARNAAILFEGFMRIEQEGVYRFFLEMNGGRLTINEEEVVILEPSGRRGVKAVTGDARLYSGWNQVRLHYIHAGKEPRLRFEMEGDALSRKGIPSKTLSISETPIEPYRPYALDPNRAQTGRHYFRDLGCANCHNDIKVPPNTVIPLADLDVSRGCLSQQVGPWPDYALSETQRWLLRKFLSKANSPQLRDAQIVAKTLVSFNCIACHERDGLGGVLPRRDRYFTGDKPLMGNQGRIPPPLTHIGAKLQTSWMRDVLARGGRQRPYLHTRMPQYGDGNVGHLVDRFERVDKLESVEIPDVRDIQSYKRAGHAMVGADYFSCIACHDFNGQESGGAGALELIHTTQRIKKNWFHLYMRQPSRFHPTVIMPTYWPNGRALMEDLLEGDTSKQIEALWVYLEDGRRARNPKGLSRQSNELRVTDVAVMCRGVGPAGYRGIAVGYPEGLNLAFDSEQMDLRFLWKGDFASINHGRWSFRGEDRISFAPGIPFHRLASMDDHWPYKRKTDHLFPQDHGYQYRGYSLDKQRRPTFRYRFGDIEIEDTFEDILNESGEAYFKRTLAFRADEGQQPFHFRAASGKNVKQTSSQTYTAEGLTLRIVSPHTGLVRQGEPEELLILMTLSRRKSDLILEYHW